MVERKSGDVGVPAPAAGRPEVVRPDQAVALVTAAIEGGVALPPERVLAALTAIQQLRTMLDEWEPRLIETGRAAGSSWTQLAGALGVSSRQAAERRYLRLRRPEESQPGTTRDERVQAVRDRRAGDRAVTSWARTNGADLRQLAGQISALTDLGPGAQPSLDQLHEALAGNDAADLVPLLAASGEHLTVEHAALADRVAAVAQQTSQVRQDTHRRRAGAAGPPDSREQPG